VDIMMRKFSHLKMYLMVIEGNFGQASHTDYAAERILFYAKRFRTMSRIELMELAYRMRRSRGFCSEKSYYMYALREECALKGISL
jgi:hypothetical protein